MEPRARFHKIDRVLWEIMGLNIMVAVAKIILGYATNTTSVAADGFHSLSDGLSNVVGLVGIRFARKPQDEDHPYGHGRYETLTSFFIAGMLLFIAYNLIQRAVGAFRSPSQPTVNWLSWVVMGASLCVNVFVVWYERRAGKTLKSDLLLADALHTVSDIYVTLSVMAALIGVHLGWAWADPAAALIVCAVIVWSAIQILWQGTDVLVDHIVLNPLLVKAEVEKVQGVLGCHEIRSRGRPDAIYVDLHMLVADDMSVKEGHDLANEVEERIKSVFSGVQDVIVHIEPASHPH